ncbi:MAG: pseudouridine synthase [Ktedonobacteraceae bacterium]
MSERPEENTSATDTEQQEREGEGTERLARFLAHAGVASRRHAEILIANGRVRVNGVVITTQGTRIDPAHDRVSVDDKQIQGAVALVYILLHKPAGYVCTVSDERGRPTVLDLLPQEIRKLRVYPVGRLDAETSGLLLMTNDGDFAQHVAHPRHSTTKRYEALVKGCPTAAAQDALRKGVVIAEDDGGHHTTAPALVSILRHVGSDCYISLTLHEGRKRQVRRMLAAVGYPVSELTRVAVGSLTLKGVAGGMWRYLTEAEVEALRSV